MWKWNKETIRSNITYCRKARGLNQKQLAKKSGITPANICRIESGRHFPTLWSFHRICETLNVPYSMIMGPRISAPIILTSGEEVKEILQKEIS